MKSCMQLITYKSSITKKSYALLTSGNDDLFLLNNKSYHKRFTR